MKKVIIYLLILISLLSLAGCGQSKKGKAQDTQKESEKTITIGVMPDVESVPFIIAEKNGYYQKEGVQVKIEHFKSASDRDSALQSGKLDGVITDVLAVVFANEGGINLRIISRNDGNIELMAGKDSGINSIQDLTGKSVGLSTNTIMEYSLDKMLEANQFKSENVKKAAIPQLPTRLEMLQGGKIDAAILPEPLSGLAIANGAKVLSDTDRMANKAGAIAFTAESIKENPEAIKAVFRAYDDAVDYLNNEPVADYVDFVIEAQGFPAAVKDTMKMPEYKKAQAPDEKIFNDVVTWMKNKNLIKGNYEYKDLVDQDILR